MKRRWTKVKTADGRQQTAAEKSLRQNLLPSAVCKLPSILHRLDRCFLRGRIGDKLNLIGSASGFNVRKLLKLFGLGIFSRALFVWGIIWHYCLIVFRAAPIFIVHKR